jgi:hypothetical protein
MVDAYGAPFPPNTGGFNGGGVGNVSAVYGAPFPTGGAAGAPTGGTGPGPSVDGGERDAAPDAPDGTGGAMGTGGAASALYGAAPAYGLPPPSPK